MTERAPMSVDLPRVLPAGCRVVSRAIDGFMLQDTTRGIAVMVSVAIERDGKPWKHVSVSRKDKRIPTYDDMAWARALVVGPNQHAYMVFPAKEEYVNMAPSLGVEVLHLFVPIDHRPLPDFRPDTKRNEI